MQPGYFFVGQHKDLGVNFYSKLTFNHHIDYITSKAMKTLGLIYRFTDITHVSALKTYFTMCVVPILEYGSCIWSMACESNLKKTNKVVSFFVRIVKHRCPTLANFSKQKNSIQSTNS